MNGDRLLFEWFCLLFQQHVVLLALEFGQPRWSRRFEQRAPECSIRVGDLEGRPGRELVDPVAGRPLERIDRLLERGTFGSEALGEVAAQLDGIEIRTGQSG